MWTNSYILLPSNRYLKMISNNILYISRKHITFLTFTFYPRSNTYTDDWQWSRFWSIFQQYNLVCTHKIIFRYNEINDKLIKWIIFIFQTASLWWKSCVLINNNKYLLNQSHKHHIILWESSILILIYQ